MKKLLLALTSALAALTLPGCLQSETTIHLNKDGSGTLVEETRLGAQMLGMLTQMSALGGGEAKEDPLAEMFSEDKAKARASKLGEGVVFTKFETVSKNGGKGARVTYSFKDINQLKVTPGDGMKDMSPMGAAQAAPAEKSEPIAFSYADGKLTVKMPAQDKNDAKDAAGADAPEGPDMDNPQAEAMMKQMMGDMKISLKLVIEPGIAESNATHADGNTITLMEMEMGKLLENPENMKKLSKMDQKNPAASMEALKGIDGVKFEVKEEITVKLK
jgi:hypothetical protein